MRLPCWEGQVSEYGHNFRGTENARLDRAERDNVGLKMICSKAIDKEYYIFFIYGVGLQS